MAQRSVTWIRRLTWHDGVLVLAIASLGLFLGWMKSQNDLLFRSLTETLIVAVSLSVFLFTWNTREVARDRYGIFMGWAFLLLSGLTLVHLLSYPGLGIFHGAQTGPMVVAAVVGRFQLALAFLLAPLIRSREKIWRPVIGVQGLISAGLLWWVWAAGVFLGGPGQEGGSPLIVVVLELGVMIMFGSALGLTWKNRTAFHPSVVWLLLGALATNVAAEISFVLVPDSETSANGLGYFFVLLSGFLFYRSAVMHGLKRPYARLFRDLAKNEERFRLFMDHVPASVFIFGRKGRIHYINRFARFFATEETWASLVQRIVPKETESRFQAPQDRAWIKVESLLNAAGQACIVEVHVFPIYHFGLKAWGSVGIDITDRVQAEVALRDSEAHLRLALNQYPCTFVIYDAQRRIDFVNDYGARLCTLEKRDILGKRDEDIFTLGVTTDYLPTLLKTYETAEPQACEARLTLPTGTFDVLAHYIPLLDSQGQVRQVFGIMQDVTERKRSEDLLRQDKASLESLVEERTRKLVDAQLALERARRLSDIGGLASKVAHELRNPLSVIRMATYNLERKLAESDLQKHVASINKKVAESEQIISNLLTYTRIKMPCGQAVCLGEILEECLATVRPRFSHKPIEFCLDHDTLAGQSVWADPLQLQEVFTNLLDNACQAIQVEPGRIRIGATQGSGRIEVVFEDNGQGIPPEDLARVFEPFFTRKAAGTGLGLAICQELVELNGGSILLESDEKKGTRVKVVFPTRNPSA